MYQITVTVGTEQDEREIRELVARLSDSWVQGDAHAYAAEFTEDCDYVAFDGTRFRGPTEPETHLARLFDTVLAGSRLEGEVESVRFITADVAAAHWTGSVAYPWQKGVKRRRLSRQTLVLLRRDGRWLATAFQNARVRPIPQKGWALRWRQGSSGGESNGPGAQAADLQQSRRRVPDCPCPFAGWSWADIARLLGVSEQAVHLKYVPRLRLMRR